VHRSAGLSNAEVLATFAQVKPGAAPALTDDRADAQQHHPAPPPQTKPSSQYQSEQPPSMPPLAPQRQSTFVRNVTQYLLDRLGVGHNVNGDGDGHNDGDSCCGGGRQEDTTATAKEEAKATDGSSADGTTEVDALTAAQNTCNGSRQPPWVQHGACSTRVEQQHPRNQTRQQHSRHSATTANTAEPAATWEQFNDALASLSRLAFPRIANRARSQQLLISRYLQPLAARNHNRCACHADGQHVGLLSESVQPTISAADGTNAPICKQMNYDVCVFMLCNPLNPGLINTLEVWGRLG
jgi:hypothetical protein